MQDGDDAAAIKVNIRTLKDPDFSLDLLVQDTVGKLKELIHGHKGIVSSKQRLIYQGRILQDNQSIESYKIRDGHTVHLIESIVRPEVNSTSSEIPRHVPSRRRTVSNPSRMLMATQFVFADGLSAAPTIQHVSLGNIAQSHGRNIRAIISGLRNSSTSYLNSSITAYNNISQDLFPSLHTQSEVASSSTTTTGDETSEAEVVGDITSENNESLSLFPNVTSSDTLIGNVASVLPQLTQVLERLEEIPSTRCYEECERSASTIIEKYGRSVKRLSSMFKAHRRLASSGASNTRRGRVITTNSSSVPADRDSRNNAQSNEETATTNSIHSIAPPVELNPTTTTADTSRNNTRRTRSRVSRMVPPSSRDPVDSLNSGGNDSTLQDRNNSSTSSSSRARKRSRRS